MSLHAIFLQNYETIGLFGICSNNCLVYQSWLTLVLKSVVECYPMYRSKRRITRIDDEVVKNARLAREHKVL